MSKLRQLFSSPHFWPIVIISAVTLMAYWNSLPGEFVYDDNVVIVDRVEIQSLHSIPTLFKQSYWGPGRGSFGAYRPLTNVSFALNYAVSGLNPTGYHIVNILLHGVNAVLIYALVLAYLENWSVALITGVFFAIHPIHTEAVSAIAGRPEVLAATFCLSAWLVYRFRTESLRFYWYVIILYFLALFSKESSIALLGALILVDIYQFWPYEWRTRWKSLLVGYAGFLIPIGLYLGARILVLAELGVTEDESFFKDATWSTRLLTMSYGLVKMIQLLAWPVYLAADYDFSQIPLTHMLTLKAGLSLALVGGLVVAGVILFQYEKITSFAILFFFGTTLLISNLIFPIGILIAERTLYFPSISVCLVGAAGLVWITQRGNWWRIGTLAGCLVLTVAGIARTYVRNLDWRTPLAFTQALVRDAPQNPRGYLMQGQVLASLRRDPEAEQMLKAAVSLDPNKVDLHTALAEFYIARERYSEAQLEVNRAIELKPANLKTRLNQARLLAHQDKSREAVLIYQEIVDQLPPKAITYHEFAVLLAQTGNLKAAETEFLRVIEIDPAYTEAYLNLGLLYRTLGNLDQAILALRQGIDVDPRNAALHATLGQIWLIQQNLGAAVQELQLAVTLNPACAECFNNLGVALVQHGKEAEALHAFEQAVKLNPNYLGAVQNLERLRQQLKPPHRPPP